MKRLALCVSLITFMAGCYENFSSPALIHPSSSLYDYAPRSLSADSNGGVYALFSRTPGDRR